MILFKELKTDVKCAENVIEQKNIVNKFGKKEMANKNHPLGRGLKIFLIKQKIN